MIETIINITLSIGILSALFFLIIALILLIKEIWQK
jgi:hypothetical protein